VGPIMISRELLKLRQTGDLYAVTRDEDDRIVEAFGPITMEQVELFRAAEPGSLADLFAGVPAIDVEWLTNHRRSAFDELDLDAEAGTQSG
jgi:hypothetical protein